MKKYNNEVKISIAELHGWQMLGGIVVNIIRYGCWPRSDKGPLSYRTKRGIRNYIGEKHCPNEQDKETYVRLK